MSLYFVKFIIIIGFIGCIDAQLLIAQKNKEVMPISIDNNGVQPFDTALSVIRATVTPYLSGEMGRGMEQLYRFTLLVKRPGNYRFPTIWIEGQSYPLVLGMQKEEEPFHHRDNELTLTIVVKPYEEIMQTEPIPKEGDNQEAMGLIEAIDDEHTFYIPILSITPLPKVIVE